MCQLHRFFGPDYEAIWEGERTARTGCVDTKQLLAERIIDFFHAMRVKRRKLADEPDLVEATLDAGARRARSIAVETMQQIRKAVGIGPPR